MRWMVGGELEGGKAKGEAVEGGGGRRLVERETEKLNCNSVC